MSRGHPISEDVKIKLLELLGYETSDLLNGAVRHQFPGMKVVRKEPGAPLLLGRDLNSDGALPKNDLGKIIDNVEIALGLYIDGAPHLDNSPAWCGAPSS